MNILNAKKGIFFIFFIFVSNIINRVFLRKALSFCVNFLLLCLLRVYFAPYTLKKIRCFYTLVSKYFVSYMLMIVKKGLYTLSSKPHWHPIF